MSCEGQIEGGAVMGVGLALSEELPVEDGRFPAPNLHDYGMPTAVDAPPIDVTLVETVDELGPFGAKGIGEGGIIGLRWDGDELHIGSAATIRQVECDPTVIARASALAEAARVLGSVQIRNMATLGGNLCNASPAAEMAPPLMAHNAAATVHGPYGTRRQSVAALATESRATSLKAGEILTSVRLRLRPHSGSCYVRQTVRWAMDLAGVGAAAWVLTEAAVATVAWCRRTGGGYFGSAGMRISITVNGDPVGQQVDPCATVLSLLREQLHLTGTKWGCLTGDCGACTVIVDADRWCRACRPSGRSTEPTSPPSRASQDSGR